MYRILVILLSIALISSPLRGQTLSGTITDERGEPLPYATVYVKEMKLGTSSNPEGKYSLQLPEGKYSLVFQSLGFETIEKQQLVCKEGGKLDVKLKIKPFQIAAVTITSNSEDAAYGIMRKAIGMAPYYQNQVKDYQAEVYMKGSIKIKKFSWIVKRAIRKEPDAPKEGVLYLQESVNNIHFTAPDKYDQHVRMIRSNFPSDDSGGENAMEFINASLYQPKVGEMILPLAPYAFNHYKFRYEGYSMEGDRVVNKIKVIPKRKSPQLLEGYVYIADNYWNLHGAELVAQTIAGELRIKQNFGEVEKNIWMPISFNFEIDGKMLGNEADIRYIASVKYKSVLQNSDIKMPANLAELIKSQGNAEEPKPVAHTAVKPKNPKQAAREQKRQEKIETLLKKEELTNREMHQLAQLMDKHTREADTLSKSLEVKRTHNVKVDSLARKADSTQWHQIRPIALTPEEIKGMDDLQKHIARNDSVNSKKDTIKKKDNVLTAILTGKTWRNKEDKWSFTFSGLITPDEFRFNTVDGFVVGMSFGYRKKYKENQLSISPSVAYAINRNALMGKLATRVTHTPMRRGMVGINLGSESTDFNTVDGINRFGNTIASLGFRTNYMKLYEHQYGEVYNKIDIANGFELYTRFGYYNRTMLRNSTDYSLFFTDEKNYSSNLPVNDTILGSRIVNHQASILTLRLSYTPRYYYQIYENRKYMLHSAYPTFMLQTRLGVPDLAGSDVKFLHVELGIQQILKFGPQNSIRYKVRVGGFPVKDKLYYTDYKHFNTQEILALFGDFEESYQLLEYYKHSAGNTYAQAFASFRTPYLLLKFLPFLSNRIWMENLYLSSLSAKGSKPYWEFGYALNQIGILGGVGIFVGFEGQKYSVFGVKASIALEGEVSI